jgi:16S rRNA processing protein RimM
VVSGPARPEGAGEGTGEGEADGDAASGDSAAAGTGAGIEPDPDGPALLYVGRMVKPHGLRGDVIVSLTTNRDERVAPGSVLSATDGRRFRVVRSSSHQGRFIVTFDGVAGIDAAEELRDTDLYAPPLQDPDTLWVHELIGATVEDTGGIELGTVVSVEANPASDLLVLSGGALIPLRFVVASVPGERVTVDVPDGLLDLA